MVPVRTNKKTLVSPIPALLAAQMTNVMDHAAQQEGTNEEHKEAGVADGTPLPFDIPADATDRVSDDQQQLMLSEDDEADYVVELVEGIKVGATGR